MKYKAIDNTHAQRERERKKRAQTINKDSVVHQSENRNYLSGMPFCFNISNSEQKKIKVFVGVRLHK